MLYAQEVKIVHPFTIVNNTTSNIVSNTCHVRSYCIITCITDGFPVISLALVRDYIKFLTLDAPKGRRVLFAWLCVADLVSFPVVETVFSTIAGSKQTK